LFFSPCYRHASGFVTRGANRIGRIYKKAVYRQFTDDTYTQEIPKPSWLGFLGPVMKAEEEDIFIVHLRNFASRPYSLHPHGLFYDKDSEGKNQFSAALHLCFFCPLLPCSVLILLPLSYPPSCICHVYFGNIVSLVPYILLSVCIYLFISYS
uniref:Plastocyanin-like domain-containing protein n=1 Tax=Pelusios castaneus TaxID=367368 RepID=A0A8C8VFH9_9SAUR